MNVNFTERELDIIMNIAKGLSNEEIGKVLFLSKHTIKSNLERIYAKTHCNNRVQLVIWALQHNILNI